MTLDQDGDGHSAGRPVKMINTLCGSTSCPTIYEAGQDTLVVQGFSVSPATVGLDIAEGERLVEIPVELLREAARLLS